MKRVITFVAVLSVLVASVVACGGPSKAEIAKQSARDEAIKKFSSLRNDSPSGAQAEELSVQILSQLASVDLTLDVIGTNGDELTKFIQEGWARDARVTLRSLRDMKALPEQAKTMKLQFVDESRRSEKVLANFGTSEAELNNIVNRNALEFIQRNGGRPTPAQYQAAGLPVPTITKTRTIVKRVPAKPTTAATRTPRKSAPKPAVRTGG
ncbi:MAG: hypothetical protein AAB638_00935 [Patescibacteria group bacterium]